MGVVSLIVFSFILCQIGAQTLEQDCQTLRVRCSFCTRRLNEGRGDEDNLIGRVNSNCALLVGRTWVWRDLTRCDMGYIRCKTMNRALTCALIAEEARMLRRVP